jgi:HEAT repeat protein
MNDRSSTNVSPRPQLAPCERAELALLYSRNDDALPLFLAHIANTNAPNRAEVVFLVGLYDLTTNAGPAVPMLIQCLIDNDPEVIKEAARALTECDLKPGLILPALTNSLGTSTNSLLRSRVIWALGKFKSQVRLTQPFLIAALQDPDANVRKQATNALLKIAPEVLTNAPTE